MSKIEQTVDDPSTPLREKMQAQADEAKKRSKNEQRRSLEIRASFYERLSVLDAGSIAVAVSVGIALVSNSALHVGSMHAQLTWLVWIAIFLWVSLICSIEHNSYFVKVTRLEAEGAEAWSNYLGLIAASITASGDTAEIVSKHIADTLHDRIMKAALNSHHTEQSAYRALYLGKIAVASFLIAYTLVLVCVISLWWRTR